jgi:hypothetical protein
MVAGNPWSIQARWLPDDLEMGGCQGWDWPSRARLCLEAGHQALLVCQTEAGVDACARAAEQLPESLGRPAVARFMSLRRALPAPVERFDQAGWDEWVREF